MKKFKFYSNYNIFGEQTAIRLISEAKRLSAKKCDINDIIELYNISKFINNESFLNLCKKLVYHDNLNITVNSIIGKYVNFINDSNAEFLFNKIETNYKDDFFEIIDKYKLYESITPNVLKKIIGGKNIYLSYVLHNKGLVKAYDEQIKEILLNTINGAELLIEEYEIAHLSSYKHMLFPKSLTNED